MMDKFDLLLTVFGFLTILLGIAVIVMIPKDEGE